MDEIHTVTVSSAAALLSTSAQRAFLTIYPKPGSPFSFQGLYDTGAGITVLAPRDFQLLRAHGHVQERASTGVRVVTASQQPMNILGSYKARFYVGKKLITAIVLVSPDVKHSIIGMNVIRPSNLTLDPISLNVRCQSTADLAAIAALQTGFGPLAPGEPATPFAQLRLPKAVTIPARTGLLVKVGMYDNSGEKITQPLQGLADCDLLSVAFQASTGGCFYMHLPNSDFVDRELPRGFLVGRAYSLDDWTPVSAAEAVHRSKSNSKAHKKHTRAEIKKIRATITAQVNASVPYLYRSDYIKMLMARHQYFSASSLDLGFCDKVQHTIDLESKTPVFSPQFRLPAQQLQLIRENVAGWLQAGIIERCNSPYNSPIFCVPKKQGMGMRCVLDYRRLNAASMSDKYSIRTIDECLESIGRSGSTVFSCLDLTNGYWQLQLRPSDRPFTAFTIPGKGQFQWTTCPQGLMGAPASFSRLMDLIMEDAEHVISYLDDVLIHSSDHKSHIAHLAAALVPEWDARVISE